MSNLPSEFEPTTHTYSRGANLLCDAAKGFDLDVSDEQADQWRLVFVAMHELDGLLDSNAPYTERSTQYDSMVDVIMGDAIHACTGCYGCQLQVHMAEASAEQRNIFKNNTELIKILGEDRRASTKVRQLGHLSMDEGRMSAELLELNDQSQQANAFNRWLGNVGIFGAVIDTAIDLPSDYETGLTQVRPVLRNRLALASMGVPYATRVARHMNISLVRSFTKAFFAVSNDRTKDLIQQAA
jgi:hypothetical protein